MSLSSMALGGHWGWGLWETTSSSELKEPLRERTQRKIYKYIRLINSEGAGCHCGGQGSRDN